MFGVSFMSNHKKCFMTGLLFFMKRLAGCCALVAIGVLGAVNAQEECFNENYYYNSGCDQNWWVLGFNIGYVTSSLPGELYDLRQPSARNPSVFGRGIINEKDDTHFALNPYLGYRFQISCGFILGADVGYKKFGKMERKLLFTEDESQITPKLFVKSQGFDCLLVLQTDFQCNFNAFVKLGVMAIWSDWEQDNFVSSINPSLSGRNGLGLANYNYFNLSPEWVIGIGYQINCCYNLIFSYSSIGSDFTGTPSYNMDGIMTNQGGAPAYNMVSVGFESSF